MSKKSKKSQRTTAKAAPPPKPKGGAFTSPRPVLDFLYYALALAGILVVVHLHIQSGRGFDRGCFGFSAPETVQTSANCEVVLQSDAGKLLGVSNIVWGLLFYAGLAVVSFLSIRQDPPAAMRTKRFRLLMIAVGLAYSAYLSYVQYFQLGEFCKLCLISASIVLVLAVVSAVDVATSNRTN